MNKFPFKKYFKYYVSVETVLWNLTCVLSHDIVSTASPVTLIFKHQWVYWPTLH